LYRCTSYITCHRIHSCCSPARCSPTLAQISFTPHSCPIHFFMPPISPHSPSLATARMASSASTGAITCSTTAAPAAVSGIAHVYETPQLVTMQAGRHPPPQTKFNTKVYDDQGNLRLSAVRNGPAAGLGEMGPRESTFTNVDPAAIGDMGPQGRQIPHRLPAVPELQPWTRIEYRSETREPSCVLAASTPLTTPRILTHRLKIPPFTTARRSAVTTTTLEEEH
jgi:hypothetical protein